MDQVRHKLIQALIVVACLVFLFASQVMREKTPDGPADTGVCGLLNVAKLSEYLELEVESLPEKLSQTVGGIKIVECKYQDKAETKGAYFWVRIQPGLPKKEDGTPLTIKERVKRVNRQHADFVDTGDFYEKYEDQLEVYDEIGDGAVWDPQLNNVVFFKGNSVLSLWIHGLPEDQRRERTLEFAQAIVKGLEKAAETSKPYRTQ